MGHRQAFTAICSDKRICVISLRPDRMHPIGNFFIRGAGCHECEEHCLYGASRHIMMQSSKIWDMGATEYNSN
eukprot:6172642-Pleurochrysis_carterae.AAC.2